VIFCSVWLYSTHFCFTKITKCHLMHSVDHLKLCRIKICMCLTAFQYRVSPTVTRADFSLTQNPDAIFLAALMLCTEYAEDELSESIFCVTLCFMF